MNRTQHTPGPWKPLLNAFAVCTDNSAPLQANICLLDKKSQNVDEDTTRANARLIAAAPELLAACRKAETAIDLHAYLTSEERERLEMEAVSAIRKAIAKAIGQ